MWLSAIVFHQIRSRLCPNSEDSHVVYCLQLFDGEKFYLEQDSDGVTQLKEDANKRLDSLLQTVSRTQANKVDGKISDTLRNVLFGAFGEDLASRNIFRGRDVGLPSYSEMMKCYRGSARHVGFLH